MVTLYDFIGRQKLETPWIGLLWVPEIVMKIAFFE